MTMDIDAIAAQAKDIASKANLTRYEDMFAKVVASVKTVDTVKDPTETAACVMFVLLSDAIDENSNLQAKMDKTLKAAAADNGDAADDNSTVQRFFINLGEADGLEADTLKDFVIKNVPSVKAEDFTDAYLKDTFSFFELPKTVAQEVLDKVNGQMYNEREVHVELSEKKDRSSRGGFGGHRSFGGHGFGHSDRGGYGHRIAVVTATRDRGGYGHSDQRRLWPFRSWLWSQRPWRLWCFRSFFQLWSFGPWWLRPFRSRRLWFVGSWRLRPFGSRRLRPFGSWRLRSQRSWRLWSFAIVAVTAIRDRDDSRSSDDRGGYSHYRH
jgi:hypothetical protein